MGGRLGVTAALLAVVLVPGVSSAAGTLIDHEEVTFLPNGSVQVRYRLTPPPGRAVRAFSLKYEKVVVVEDAEAPAGWKTKDRSPRKVAFAAGKKPAAGEREFQVTLEVRDPEDDNPFQMRRPPPLFTVTVHFAGGGTVSEPVVPPAFPSVR